MKSQASNFSICILLKSCQQFCESHWNYSLKSALLNISLLEYQGNLFGLWQLPHIPHCCLTSNCNVVTVMQLKTLRLSPTTLEKCNKDSNFYFCYQRCFISQKLETEIVCQIITSCRKMLQQPRSQKEHSKYE